MDDHEAEVEFEFSNDSISSRRRDEYFFDGWGDDGVNVYFVPLDLGDGRQTESVILISGGIFRSWNGTTVIRVEDTEHGVEQDPENPDFEISHASLVLRFTETEYHGSERGAHSFSGILTEAFAYDKDVQTELDYGKSLEDILYGEDDYVSLDPPDAGILAHLVGQKAGIRLSPELGFKSHRYTPRRSEEIDRLLEDQLNAYSEPQSIEREE